MADFNGINGDWEKIKAKLLAGTGPNPGEPGIQDATMSDFVAPYVGGKVAQEAMGAVGPALKGLGEAGEITIGKAAPQFEGEVPDLVRYTKGVMGKGTPNEMLIENVKGPVEQIRKLGYGDDPGSIPSHILDKFKIPSEAPKMNMPDTGSPSGSLDNYAHGGEVMRHYDDGGDVTDPNDEAAQLLSGQGNGMPFLQGTPQMAAQPANMQNAALAGIAGAFGNMPPSMPPGSHQPINIQQSIPPASAPLPQSLTQTAQNAQNMPPTDYSLFKGISGDDRAALYKQLLQKQAGGGSAAISGLAGIGDAISRSFGHQNTNYQKDVRENQNQNMDRQLGMVDTQRKQKLEDISGNQEMALADPQSGLSQSIRKTLQSAGLRVPSNMPGNMMLKISGPLGELAMKQATLEETKNYHKGELGQAANALQNKEETYASEHPILNFFNPVNQQHPTSPISNTNITGGAPQMGQMFNNEKIIGVKRIK